MTTGRPSRLIVNADDFGRAPGVTRGIVEAHHRGIVTSTTAMVNLPWSSDAFALARSEAPALAIGLHLTLCYGPPLFEGSDSLLDDRGRLNRDLIALASRANPHDIEREARAQLARFVALAGRLPTHLDSHLHVHTWPVCHPPLIRIALEHGLPVRPADPPTARALRAAGVITVDRFVNDFFTPGQMTLDGLVHVLRSVGNGTTELMVHPGYDDEHLADSSFRAQRERELACLTDPLARETVEERRIQLTSYADLMTG